VGLAAGLPGALGPPYILLWLRHPDSKLSGPPETAAMMAKKSSEFPAEVQLFADGGCSGNPGPGGWAFILRHPTSGKELERSGGEREATNNRMELTAVIRGLETLTRPARVELLTDSTYVGKGVSEWLPKWKAQGWRRKEGNRLAPIKNEDLWRRLDELLQTHQVRFTHVRGHSGHVENERCDTLAVAAYQKYL